ncbi:MAG: hypothetical protein LBE13_01145 [Bacteroidales bacterium]|jgi:arginyl-tRNA synthetase|nr:hypothetical protein [Bacteroidales bacterium]
MIQALFFHYRDIIKDHVGDDEHGDLIVIDVPRDESFGDFSSNIALVLAKRVGRRALSRLLVRGEFY